MDHRLIEEQNVAESYVAGQLPPEEEARFEEHLLECRECRERVAWADDLKASFRGLANDEGKSGSARVLPWRARPGRLVWLAAAAALFLLALALPAWLLVHQGRLRAELAAARRPSPPVPGRPSAAELAARRRLTEELQAERRKNEELAGRVAALTRPQVNAALFSLGLVRGDEETNRVVVSREPEWIVLAIETPSPDVGTYEAALLDARGRTVWRGSGLRPTAADTLVLGLYSDLLPPGSYRLVLTGRPPHGRSVTSTVPFRVERGR
jgi:Putative zinc-finger